MTSLAGLRVVVTRAAHQAEELAGPLREAGAEVILLPMIAIGPPDLPGELTGAAVAANDYDWIIFTSTNAVAAFRADLPGDPSELHARIATVGDRTRDHAEQLGFKVSLVPDKYVAESLIDSFADYELNDKKVLIPRAAVARDIIPTELRKRGAHVTVVEAYRNVVPPDAKTAARAVFCDPLPDWVLFASSSAVENLIQIVGTGVMERVRIGSIGPVTSGTLRKYDLRPAAEASEHNTAGLIAAIAGSRR